MAIKNEVFASMSDADRDIVVSVMNKLFNEIDSDNRKDNQKAYDALVAQGIKVTSPGERDTPAWQAVASKSIDELVESG